MPPNTTPRPLPIPLSAASLGRDVIVAFLSLNAGAVRRLHDVGIREGCALHVVRSEGRVIVGLDGREGMRVGVPADLAAGVFVEEVLRR